MLFDEIEKAHPDVWNALLQILEDGRLTDGQGRTVDFRNTVIVMTSNLGSSEIQAHAGEQHYDEIKNAVMEQVGRHFRPEFINRIDETVVFHPLTQEQIRAIAQIQLQSLTARLKEKDIGITISDAAMDTLGELGFDPVYGARPLKREIQQAIENPVAMSILAGEFAAGDHITVDIDVSGRFSFAKQQLH